MSGQRPSRSKIDPAVDMMKRIERLERRDAHPDSRLGLTTADIGSIEPTDAEVEGHGWYAVIDIKLFALSLDEDIVIDLEALT
jgi:hypothetical protein